MEWWLLTERLGFKFDPTDAQLILDYLYPKVQEWGGLCDFIGISDQVYTNPPWEYYCRTRFPGGENYYCYTKLNNLKQYQNRVARKVGSYGNWHESKLHKISVGTLGNGIIGFKKLFNFKEIVGGVKMPTDWLMHEFSLPEYQGNLALCVIHKKKNEEEEICERYLGLEHMSLKSFLEIHSAAGDPYPAFAHDDHF